MTIINEGGKNKLKHKILQEEGEAGLKKSAMESLLFKFNVHIDQMSPLN